MTVEAIYQAVRLCFDEESRNDAGFASASDGDTQSMNHIIKGKLGDALRWICLYAPAEQLSGGGSTSDGSVGIIEDASGIVPESGLIPLGPNFIRLIRMRCDNWHRAVMGNSLLREDSDEYLWLRNGDGAEATNDRPQAAIIEKAQKYVEVWPHPTTPIFGNHYAPVKYTLTKLVMPSVADLSSLADGNDVGVPPLLQTSFIYYVAFLVLSAYGDVRAPRMLEIARQNLGLTDDQQRS
ncbi:MAG: hypothetical protein IJ551_01775 [Prevotella sp.]|nr:hypothetical protein [Prevotella sp.]